MARSSLNQRMHLKLMVNVEEDGLPAIGIDLGTTYSCVGVWHHGKCEIIVNGQGNRTTPSLVAFTDHDVLVGDAAMNQMARNSTNTISDAKRLIGRKFSDKVVQEDIELWPFNVMAGEDDEPVIVVVHEGEEKRLSAKDISSIILANLREIAEAYLGSKVKKAVVTVPAYFNNSQRKATRDAGVAAGLDVIRVVNEPIAAAVVHGENRRREDSKQEKQTVLVFDLGGGTFDVSILLMDGSGVLKVVSTAGDTHLGGVDFDNRLVNYCIREFKRKQRMKDLVSCNPRAIRRLRTACERAKRTLSFVADTSIEVEYLFDDVDFQCTVTSAKFEQLNMDLFKRCLQLVDRCLEDARMEKKDIDEVLLVGGSTKIPKIHEMLVEFFSVEKGVVISRTVNPDEAVATGAAILAAALGGNPSQKVDFGVVPMAVTPLSLGIRVAGWKMSVLIPRNATIPARKEKVFTTTFDNQTTIRFQVFEGEDSRTIANTHLGTFELSGIPEASRSVNRVNVSFEIDQDGILTVTAEDQASNGKANITITNIQGRSEREERRRAIQAAVACKTTASLGINTVGGEMSFLIPINTNIPVKKEKVYTTSYDDQSSIRFHIYEGENSLTRDNRRIGKFELSGITRAQSGVPRITVCFEIDFVGLLIVSAEDKNTMTKTSVTITRDNDEQHYHLEEEVLKDDDRSMGIDDTVVARRGELENYLYDIRNIIKVKNIKSRKLDGVIEKALIWLKNNSPFVEAEELDGRRKQVERICCPIIFNKSMSEIDNVRPNTKAEVSGNRAGDEKMKIEMTLLENRVNWFMRMAYRMEGERKEKVEVETRRILGSLTKGKFTTMRALGDMKLELERLFAMDGNVGRISSQSTSTPPPPSNVSSGKIRRKDWWKFWGSRSRK